VFHVEEAVITQLAAVDPEVDSSAVPMSLQKQPHNGVTEIPGEEDPLSTFAKGGSELDADSLPDLTDLSLYLDPPSRSSAKMDLPSTNLGQTLDSAVDKDMVVQIPSSFRIPGQC
jgi:hypothetical protein